MHNSKALTFGKFQRNMFHGFEDYWLPPDQPENDQTIEPSFSSLNLPPDWPYSGQSLYTASDRSPGNEAESLNLKSEIMIFTQDLKPHKLRKHIQKYLFRDLSGRRDCI